MCVIEKRTVILYLFTNYHSSKLTYSCFGQYRPGSHTVHCVALPTEYVPGVQTTFLLESDVFGHAEPGGQEVQVVAPASLYVPKEKPIGALGVLRCSEGKVLAFISCVYVPFIKIITCSQQS